METFPYLVEKNLFKFLNIKDLVNIFESGLQIFPGCEDEVVKRFNSFKRKEKFNCLAKYPKTMKKMRDRLKLNLFKKASKKHIANYYYRNYYYHMARYLKGIPEIPCTVKELPEMNILLEVVEESMPTLFVTSKFLKHGMRCKNFDYYYDKYILPLVIPYLEKEDKKI